MINQTNDCPYVISLSNNPQLFLDDHCVGWTINMTRQMQPASKHTDNPIIEADYPWEQGLFGLNCPAAFYDPTSDRFRMRYSAFEKNTATDKPQKSKYKIYLCCAESQDGFEWHKVLADDNTKYNQPNNIVDGPWLIIHTPHDSDRPFKGLTHSKNLVTAIEFGTLGMHSMDGINWSPPNGIHITDTKCDTISSLVWFNAVQKYFVFTRTQMWHPDLEGHLRVTGIIESRDFEHWEPKRGINLISEAEGFPYLQVHGLNVHEYGDILIGLIPMVHLQEPGNNFLGKFDIQMAISRDGWHWQRVADGDVFLPNGPENWDRWYVHSCSMVRKKDTLYYYYQGRPQMHGAIRQMREQGVDFNSTMRTDLGMATVPADRFVAMIQKNSDELGILDTPPIRFDGNDLLVNAELDPTDMQVELIDEAGPVAQYQSKVVPGFEREYSRLVKIDDLRYKVLWSKEGTEYGLSKATDHQPLLIRFLIRKGKLFSFQVI